MPRAAAHCAGWLAPVVVCAWNAAMALATTQGAYGVAYLQALIAPPPPPSGLAPAALALANLALSLALGLGAVALGWAVAATL